ncbi:hypothetical protein M2137_001234 [Parabacteroides sp. PFB2-10]|uniref:fimbria major subunit n=1 Tax=Parabacteroides sp. PFB2-10 TaxID=1742405 RepID=UPI0024739D27|nr:fimbria major subunit [Parabacteroides sp. PFB2-10]MDH6312463.1 hypothetical protein [Parabacteroides sp. PFB2-10]
MKQYFYKLCMLLATALLLVACVDEDIIRSAGEEKPIVGASGNTISFRLSFPYEAPVTKAESIGTIGESLIDSVRIVFYTGSTVQYVWDLDIKTVYDETVTGKLRATGSDVLGNGKYENNTFIIQTQAKRAEKGNYKMLIIVNPNDSIKDVTRSGKTIDDLNAPFNTTKSALHKIAGSNIPGVTAGEAVYFLMLNAQGLIDITESNFYSTEEEAEQYPVIGCAVERVAAKVGLTYAGPSTVATTNIGRFAMRLDGLSGTVWNNDYDIPDDVLANFRCPICGGAINRVTKLCKTTSCNYQYGYGDGLGATVTAVRYMVATDFTWQVDITNKKSYWNRHLTYKAKGFDDADKIEKQGDTGRESFYAEDPNFLVFSDRTKLYDEFTYITANALKVNGDSARKLAPFSGYPYSSYWSWQTAAAQPVYVPENTMVKEEQLYDATTRVIVKAILKRENISVEESDGSTISTLEESYRIGDFFVFIGGMTTGYSGYNTDKNDNNYYILLADDVVKYANETKTPPYNYGEVVDGQTVISVSLAAAIAEFKNDNPTFSWSDLSKATPAYSDNLLFYKNGEIYYEIPIEHFSQTEAGGAGKYGRFGVVRNNSYNLDIQKITSIGAPTIPPIVATRIEAESVN